MSARTSYSLLSITVNRQHTKYVVISLVETVSLKALAMWRLSLRMRLKISVLYLGDSERK